MILKPRTDKQRSIVEAVRSQFWGQGDFVLPRFSRGLDQMLAQIAIATDAFNDMFDSAVDRAKVAALGRGHDITCKKGCDLCCYQPVSTSPLMAVLTANYLETHPDKKALFLEKYQVWRGKVDVAAFERAQELSFRSFTLKTMRQVDVVYNNAGCPFLDFSECMIYKVRPAICRHMISTGDPRGCNLGINNKPDPEMDQVMAHRAAMFFKGAVVAINGSSYFELYQSLFPMFVAEMLQDPSVFMQKYFS